MGEGVTKRRRDEETKRQCNSVVKRGKCVEKYDL